MALALLVLVGGAVAFAGQALDDAGRRPRNATAPPPPALTVLAPPESITREPVVDLVVVRPANLRVDQAYAVRAYVNGHEVREQELPATETFELRALPLEQGENSITVSLVGDGGEGAPSSEVMVLLDNIAPDIRVSQPAERVPVYTDSAVLRGRTEAGATLTITDARSGAELDRVLGEDGRFSAAVTLRLGNNEYVLRSVDLAGNRSSARVTISRVTSSSRLALAINPVEIAREDLPVTVSLTATVRDETGLLIDGAQVTFSVSPPDSSTLTYRATTSEGRARWNDLRLEPGDSKGVWLVTVLAVLPSGAELRENGAFSLE